MWGRPYHPRVCYAQSNQPDCTIHLKSRQLVLTLGLERALKNQLQGEAAARDCDFGAAFLTYMTGLKDLPTYGRSLLGSPTAR